MGCGLIMSREEGPPCIQLIFINCLNLKLQTQLIKEFFKNTLSTCSVQIHDIKMLCEILYMWCMQQSVSDPHPYHLAGSG